MSGDILLHFKPFLFFFSLLFSFQKQQQNKKHFQSYQEVPNEMKGTATHSHANIIDTIKGTEDLMSALKKGYLMLMVSQSTF